MIKKTKPIPDDKEQFSRFVEVAKQIDNPDAKEDFEKAITKIAKKRRAPKTQPRLSRGES